MPSSLQHARETSLAIARKALAERAAPARPVYQDVHEGMHHLAYFHAQFPQLIAALPPNFQALELGAGMGWHAALVAAHGGGSVLATEIRWPRDKTPLSAANAHAFHRLAQRDDKLRAFVEFPRDAEGNLRTTTFRDRVSFAEAGAEALPLADESVDFVYSVNCLEHIPDLSATFREAARVLRPGGIFFASTEPLYASAYGHHLLDFFPAPWAHLLWPEDELADLAVREVGTHREWEPGTPLSAKIIHEQIFRSLNRARPALIRRVVAEGRWRVEGWIDHAPEASIALAKQMRLANAVEGFSKDDLFVAGLTMRLRKVGEFEPKGIAPALFLPWSLRRGWRSIFPRRRG